MISACCSTPRNCGSSSNTVGTAMSNRLTKSDEPAADRMPQRVEQPPRRHEQNGHHAAGDVHGEHPEQRQHRQRDAVAVSQRGHHQHHGRDGDAVGGEVGHRGGVELDVGNRGERRRQRGGGRRRAWPVRHSSVRVRSSCHVSVAALTGNSQTAAASEFSVYAVVGAAPVS